MPHGIMLPVRAEEYSGWKLKGRGAGDRAGIHEPVRRGCLHESAAPGRQVSYPCLQRVPAPGPGVKQVDPDPVPRVHQQRMRVGREGGQVAELGARRAGRYAVGLEEAEIDRLDAVIVAGPAAVALAFQAVDGQRRAPVGVVTADAVSEGRETGRVELQLHKGRPGAWETAARRVGIRARGTWQQRRRIRVAHVDGEPRGDRELEPVGDIPARVRHRRPCLRIHRQPFGERDIAPGTGPSRDEPDGRLVVADVVPIVGEAGHCRGPGDRHRPA